MEEFRKADNSQEQMPRPPVVLQIPSSSIPFICPLSSPPRISTPHPLSLFPFPSLSAPTPARTTGSHFRAGTPGKNGTSVNLEHHQGDQTRAPTCKCSTENRNRVLSPGKRVVGSFKKKKKSGAIFPPTFHKQSFENCLRANWKSVQCPDVHR